MNQMTFGEILRDARERKGIDLASAARQLRIRPDILRAIEENDFSRMPPRGYARNMVNAYARFMGLNPTEITRMYLDGAYAHQVGRARAESNPAVSGRLRSRSSSRSRRDETHPMRPRDRVNERKSESASRQSSLGRTMYDDRREYGRDYGGRSSNSSGRLYSGDRTHPTRHTALPSSHYTNFYAGPRAPKAQQSRIPLIAAAAVILILLIVVICLALGGGRQDQTASSVESVPITGIDDTTKTDESSKHASSESKKSTEAVPESVTVEYEVGSQEIYAVITTDGTAEEKMISGPVTETVEVTGTWSFATWVSDSVTIKVNGEEVSFEDTDSSGMPMCTVDFEKWLKQWKEDHPNAVDSSKSSSAKNSSSTSAKDTTSIDGVSASSLDEDSSSAISETSTYSASSSSNS